MSNATANLPFSVESLGAGPFTCDLPVKGSTTIYLKTIVAQHSGGYMVPGTTSGGGCGLGIASAKADNSGSATDGAVRVVVETMRAYAFPNGTAGDAFSDTSKVGAPVYMTDDHTVADNSSSATRNCIGWFMGFESDGKVRVFMNPGYAYLINVLNNLQLLTDTPASADALRDNIVSAVAGLL